MSPSSSSRSVAATTRGRRRRAPLATTAASLLLLAATMMAKPSSAAAATLPKASCLVVLDVDRTLTGQQDSGGAGSGTNTCPDDRSFKNIQDTAYLTNGHLTLSDFALKIASTKAGKHCYLGVITAGTMKHGLDDEHKLISYQLSSDNGNAKTPRQKEMTWAHAKGTTPAPLLHSADPIAKFKAVPLIQQFYKQAAGVSIPDSAVFFYDDVEGNVQPWKNTNYNAHQISCKTRSDDPTKSPPASRYGIGKCGATAAEVDALTFKNGCSLCRKSTC